MGDAYSGLKAFRHLDVLQAIRNGEPARVPHVEIVLADRCNQACAGCAYRLTGYPSNQLFDPRRLMPTEKALEILDDCATIGVQAVQFTGGGEPTVHPDFEMLLGRALDRGLKTSVVSNGVILGKRAGLADVVAHSAWVRISLDAGTPATYAAYRRCPIAHWTHAQTAIRRLREARDRLGTGCVVGVGFVVTPENWREAADAARLAKKLGADNLRISAQFSPEDERLFAGFHADAAKVCAEAEGETCDGFAVYNRFGERLGQLRAHRPTFRLCGYQFLTTYIGADLQVYRCCSLAYNERGHIGSLDGRRFADLWLSRERFERQYNFDSRECERCQFLGVNQSLAYALDPNPQLHEEFV